MAALSAISPAKLTLYLHVGPPHSDGRHPLDSLVMFADEQAADRLSLAVSDTLSLEVKRGAVSIRDIGPDSDNLAMRAATRLSEAVGKQLTGAFSLEKNLPIAAGLGGGSANAATALHLLNELHALGLTDHALADIAIPLGGDVPACVMGRAVVMRHDGRNVSPIEESLPGLPALLVNPGTPCPTGPVFRAFDDDLPSAPFEEMEPPSSGTVSEVVSALANYRNDLEAPAVSLVPVIGEVLNCLKQQPNVRLARMAGSGASCFALFDDPDACAAALAALRRDRPHWWTVATLLR